MSPSASSNAWMRGTRTPRPERYRCTSTNGLSAGAPPFVTSSGRASGGSTITTCELGGAPTRQ